MLVLTVEEGEEIQIGHEIIVKIEERRKEGVYKVVIQAPKDVPILRESAILRVPKE